MTLTVSWLAAFMTLAVLLSYEVSLAVVQRRRAERMARTVHANLGIKSPVTKNTSDVGLHLTFDCHCTIEIF